MDTCTSTAVSHPHLQESTINSSGQAIVAHEDKTTQQYIDTNDLMEKAQHGKYKHNSPPPVSKHANHDRGGRHACHNTASDARQLCVPNSSAQRRHRFQERTTMYFRHLPPPSKELNSSNSPSNSHSVLLYLNTRSSSSTLRVFVIRQKRARVRSGSPKSTRLPRKKRVKR